ncbi:hypothetical protein BJY20_003079 [Janibacter cremeus]|uniref:Uncharacterized protein n=1 Tax=Janibacter cremeus TaxID=1285192 RepID=A0A852VRQ7_9MICO|nr:hypothetical protein [Janibacter cremeus]
MGLLHGLLQRAHARKVLGHHDPFPPTYVGVSGRLHRYPDSPRSAHYTTRRDIAAETIVRRAPLLDGSQLPDAWRRGEGSRADACSDEKPEGRLIS